MVDILQLVMPKLLGYTADLLKDGALTRYDLLKYSIIIGLIAIGIGVGRFLWRFLVFGAARKIETSLRERLYEHLQKLSVNYYNNHKTGDIMAHATNDLSNISTALGLGVTLSFDSAIIPVVATIMIIKTVGIKLAVASFIPLGILAIVIGIVARLIETFAQKMQETFSEITETARENISGIRVVKSYVQEKFEIEKFKKSNQTNRTANLRFLTLMSTLFPLIMTISAFSFVVALWYGGREVIFGSISLGDFVAFNGYLGLLIFPIASLGWLTSILERGLVSLKRVNKIWDEKPEIEDSPGTIEVDRIEGRIEFKDLEFKYPGCQVPALKNINLTLEKGKTLAVVGRTGSGKTTLVNLILRLYNVKDGSIFVDGTDINKIPLAVLRKNIGYVPQDTFLFSTSIRENISFFSGKDEESIFEAAKASRVYDNIMDFPDKFETVIGERGVTLSGGQKQRISIARAILTDPSILVLDDCLSAVDADTEREILKGLKEIMKKRTSIIVSHRISTIKDSDMIIVVEDGEIVERGSHQELLELKGLYSDMYNRQLIEQQIEEVE